ncbi:uncharacterized protein LOC17879396 isoform X2 [Capsella rubella]|uniref:uncharacterized protein LOC17879396 isoform X2 n=1 Tax=Capsella rubella TaxID=81985 RepID=UPI000CD54640|nr:uncharacterized protein LOC17879396 isoform X2 [Capsella rubella]
MEEPGYSDSISPISEPPDITNWFPSYVYESLPLFSSINDTETEVDDVVNEVNLGVVTVSNKDQKQISDNSESLPSEPPDLGNWFSSYVYESPLLDTSDGFELSVPGDNVCIVKETETENEITDVERNNVCPRSFDQEELLRSTKILDGRDHLNESTNTENQYLKKVTDFSQSESVLSEPPDVRNWFPSYEYHSPQLSDTHELEFSSLGKDELIVDESDTENKDGFGIFRKIKSKQKTVSPGSLNSNVYKDVIATNTAKEGSSDNSYSDQGMEKQFSVRLFNASKREVKRKTSFKQEPLCCEPKEAEFDPEVSRYNHKCKSPSKNEASLHELRPNHIQETIPMNSIIQKSPKHQESDDKENVHGQSTETGFVTTKKARFREARDKSSTVKPNTRVLVECSRSKDLKNIAEEEDKEERKKRRRVLGEMSNHQPSRAEEIAGKWRCPQKSKGNIVPPLKQLRLDAWIHKV